MGEAISLMNLMLKREFPCSVVACRIFTILSFHLTITHWWVVLCS